MRSEPAAIELEASPLIGALRRAGKLSLVLLSLGHFFVDLYSSALGALQPLLVRNLALSLTQAGIMGGVLIFSSSVMQPAYGYFSDRLRTLLFTSLAPAVSGIFISCLGLAPSYGWLLGMVALGGTGIAAFHPQASSRVMVGTQRLRGRWMAVFISSGTLGFALGPTYFSSVCTRFGLGQTYWAALPGVLATLLLVTMLPAAERPAGHHRERFDWTLLRNVWKPLTILYFLVFFRSIVQITFAQFLPLYLYRERGFSYTGANHALSMYLAAGALGGFIGGFLSDRIGGRAVILLSMTGCVPFLGLFFFSEGVASLAGLTLGGLMLLFTIPVNVVMAQELVPSQAGTVSALMMGFAWGMAGMVFIPLTGWAADLLSMHQVMAAQLAFPLMGFFLALKLPRG